ncbi:MAG: hypothetical protein IKK10_00070 [Clostridia bacterium]|nr:hypothetical protein [Clostridia bacterium]
MKSMKKLMAIILSIIMIFSMGVFATSATETENQVIYFEAPKGEGLLDWSHPDTRVYCHIWVYGGDTYNQFDSLAQWGSKKERCSKTDTEGVWMYDITSNGLKLEEGVTYLVFFYETIYNKQTYDILLDTTCIGDTLYCKTENYIVENPLDSNKQTIAAYWKNADPEKYGPVRQLTSIGNVVGECYAPNEDAESLYVDFIKNDLKAAVVYSGMSEAEVLKHSAAQLGISPDRAYELELDAGLHTPMTKDELPLPTTVPTVPDSTSVVTDPVETTATETMPAEVTTSAVEPTETVVNTDASVNTEPTDSVTETAPIVEDPTEVISTTAVPATDEKIESPTGTESPIVDDNKTGTKRYYFYYPEIWEAVGNEKNAGIYWWSGTDTPKSWPGHQAKKADVEGVFYYDVPKDVTAIIWNNFIDGGMDPNAEVYVLAEQTKNICSEYYEAGDSDTYPDGLESFDGMIFVADLTNETQMSVKNPYAGEWYYYYGNGEYGITPEKGDKVYTDSYLEEPLTPDEFEIGDVNADGKVNIKDATAIQKYAAKLIELDKKAQIRADYNNDAKINVKDATQIQKKIANLI